MNHERLRCYWVLMDVAKRLPRIVAGMQRGHSYLVDQLERALSSAILNLCEGNGRSSPKERRRFFDISLGSIAESSSAIDIMRAFHLVSESEANEISKEFKIAYAMIINLKKVAV